MLEKETTEILLKFLDRKVKEAEEEIEKEGKLSDDKAMPLLLRAQFNHITHLDTEISSIKILIDQRFKEVNERFKEVNERFKEVNERFKEVDERFREMDKKFDRMMMVISVGIAFLSFLIAMLYFK